MTEEQKAEEGLNKRLGTMGYLNKQNVARPYTDGFKDGYNEGMKQKINMTRIQDYPLNEWHLTKNELPELQTGNEYSDPVLCFRYHINNHGKKLKVYDLDRWNSENDIWEISGMKKDQIEAWM